MNLNDIKCLQLLANMRWTNWKTPSGCQPRGYLSGCICKSCRATPPKSARHLQRHPWRRRPSEVAGPWWMACRPQVHTRRTSYRPSTSAKDKYDQNVSLSENRCQNHWWMNPQNHWLTIDLCATIAIWGHHCTPTWTLQAWWQHVTAKPKFLWRRHVEARLLGCIRAVGMYPRIPEAPGRLTLVRVSWQLHNQIRRFKYGLGFFLFPVDVRVCSYARVFSCGVTHHLSSAPSTNS